MVPIMENQRGATYSVLMYITRRKSFPRCRCRHCHPKPSNAECICCREVDRVQLKILESELKFPVSLSMKVLLQFA